MFKLFKTKDKQIEDLKKDVEFWQREYNEMCERENRILNDYGESCRQYAELVSANKQLKEYAEIYKQKYADELQKRLKLAKIIDIIEKYENVELKVNIDWLESEVEEDG